MHNLPVIN